MRKRRVHGKERRPDLEQFMSPPVLVALATNFEVFPVRDDTADSPHAVCCALWFFEPALLATIQEEYATEIEDERQRLTLQGWPPKDTNPPTEQELRQLSRGQFAQFDLKTLWQFYSTVRHCDEPWPSEWTTVRLSELQEKLRAEIDSRQRT
jgi:hypothetical protein